MTYKQKRRPAAGRTMCLLAGTMIAGLAGIAPASAADWKFGNIDVNLKSTVSAGLGVRTVDPDGDLISFLNGGRDTNVAAENFDDGNLNFKRGDIFTASTRMLHELDMSWENYGAFVSVSYFYDFVNNDADSTRRTDLSSAARSQAGRGFDLYDAYVYGDFDVAGMPLTVRGGNQVINWGEALFRPGGINQTNAVDVSRLVTPGTNIREGYLPSPMIYANIAPLPGFSLEAYYQFLWRNTELVPVGTFHSTEDILGEGAQGFFFAGDPGGVGYPAAIASGIPKLADDEPNDSGQYGVAARYFIDSLATETSLYYLNYHAKTPYLSATGSCFAVFLGTCLFAAPTGYYAYFPEDIDLYGASVSFPLGPVAVGAEVAYQPDFPLMLDDALTAATTAASASLGTSRVDGVTYADRMNYIANAAVTVAPSLPYIGQVPGWIGADTIDLYGEVGVVTFDETPVGVSGNESAWGFTTSASAVYSNVFVSGLKLTPSISFNCDVNGTALDRSVSGTPVEGKRAVSIGVSADYRSTYTASIQYTNNIGGGLIARNSDRDFVTVTASYSF
ncbi:DUF1302 domain-containing protein [Parvibaculum sp.]|jgi:hypothetical protein|uniref:DUF1302 domain-containing protein n=1 Tax=Parvibaculum sp. TaxID=2024848 RepID=UPI002FD89EB9